jgi:ABC-2 type transport system permease protein
MKAFAFHQLWLVFKREYRVRVRSKAFIVSTILIPSIFAFVAGAIGIIAYLETPQLGSQSSRVRSVVVIRDPVLRGILIAQFSGEPVKGYDFEIDPDDSAAHREWLQSQVRTSALAAYVWLNASAPVERAEYYFPNSDNSRLYSYLRRNIGLALVRARLVSQGIAVPSIEGAFRPPQVEFHLLRPNPARDDFVALISIFVLFYVLAIALMMYGAMVAGSIAEEKQSRIVELLLLSTTAEELMGGKILGVGCVGLTQMGIWVALGVFLSAGFPRAAESLQSIHLGSGFAACLFTLFVLGYVLYSTLFAIGGALAGGNQASAHWMTLPMLPAWIPLALVPIVSSDPNSTFSVVFSLIPYSAPVLMSARIAATAVPSWQIALCFFLILFTAAASWVACARIYRVGILMYGKRLTIREVARWVRYA